MSAHDVQIADLAAIPIVAVKRVAARSELSNVVPAGCGLVWNSLKAQGQRGGRHVAIYWDGVIHVDVGAEFDGPFEETSDVVRSATPSGRAAFATHFGPYQQLGAAHRAITEYCKANNLKLRGPNWEIYGHWQDSWNTDPSRIRTDVFYQLA